MGYGKALRLLLILTVTLGCLFLTVHPTTSLALKVSSGSFSARNARADVRVAERNLERAETRLREARHVQRDTRAASDRYGHETGRWVRLARRSGYGWWEMPVLMRVIDRESEGHPGVPNAGGSGALGLLQIMPEWADGSKTWYWHPYGLPALWDRTNARQSLLHGAHMSLSNWGE